MKSEIRNQVEEFMLAGGQTVKDSPEEPDAAVVRLRARLIVEEMFEYLEASFGKSKSLDMCKNDVNTFIQNQDVNVDMVEIADACADLDYVVEGARLAYGINGKPIADEVHRTNMAKFGPGSYVREDGKLMKPPGWLPPDIGKILDEQKVGK